MESALAWIGQIAEFIGRFFPRLLVVMASHRGVKYVRGKHVRPIGPGLHVYWPLVTEIELCAVVRQVLNLNSQILETKDGVCVVVGGLVVYSVEDAQAFLAENEDAFQSIDDVATAAIRKVVVSTPYEALRSEQRRTDAALSRETRKLLAPFGVEVEYARLTDFARARVIHLSGVHQ